MRHRMKILVFFLLMSSLLLGQNITVVGDTTDLKNYKGSNVVLLEKFGRGNLKGGGLFIRIDSTYTEGRDAFDYYGTGKQWTRISYVEFGELYKSTNDTTNITVDSTDYTINGLALGNYDGITLTDSSITLISDAYYSITGQISYVATDSVKYILNLFKNNTADSHGAILFEVPDNSVAIQNLSINSIVYSDGNDIFKLKVRSLENADSKKFIIRKANLIITKLK